MTDEIAANSVLVCVATDAFRAVIGLPTKNYTVDQIIDWLKQHQPAEPGE